jgi:hypothetical protein
VVRVALGQSQLQPFIEENAEGATSGGGTDTAMVDADENSPSGNGKTKAKVVDAPVDAQVANASETSGSGGTIVGTPANDDAMNFETTTEETTAPKDDNAASWKRSSSCRPNPTASVL